MADELDIEQPDALRAYLRRLGKVGEDEPLRISVLAGGVSNKTVLVERASGEAWVLKQGASGLVAVPAGTADRGDVFTLSLTAPLGAGDGVAITLEPASGSAQPTTQPVLAIEKT